MSRQGAVVRAGYIGECFSCYSLIEVGEPIQRSDSGDWEHSHCPPEIKLIPNVCPSCFMEKSVDGHCYCDEEDS